MKYKSLLALHCVHDSIASLKSTISMAKSMRAHLDILVLNFAPPALGIAPLDNAELDWSRTIQDAVMETSQREKDVAQWVSDKDVDVNVSSSCQPLGLIDNEVAALALYADLIIYHRCDESMVNGLMAKAVDGAIFDASKPMLIMGTRLETVGDDFRHISIAWDPTPGTMKAVTASLPLLKRANSVDIVVVTKPNKSDHHSESTGAFQTWLTRHDIDAQITIVPQSEGSVSSTLLPYINQSSNDLFVMGAYGHSRFSERLFGGVSHAILENSQKSLFIAH